MVPGKYFLKPCPIIAGPYSLTAGNPMAEQQASLQKRRAGFTLIEMSIVLLIIAVITGLAFTAGISVIATARQSATVEKMRQIEQALLKYRIANDRIPCPASLIALPTSLSTYGLEVADTGNTTTRCGNANFTVLNAAGTAVVAAEGGVPVLTLGLPADFMYDGWGNRFRYGVDVSMTYSGAFSGNPVGAVCGAITVNTGPNYPASTARSTGSIYVLLSHGSNAHGGYTQNGVITNSSSANLDELANCHCNSSAVATTYTATYVQELPVTQDPTNVLKNFDDIVVYRERWQMQAAKDSAGTVCPAVYVSDTGNKRIEKYDLYGNYLSQFGSSGSTNGLLNGNNGIFLDGTGNVWVADTTNNRVQKFSSLGAYSAAIGSSYNGVTGSMGASGTGSGQFNAPTGVALDSGAGIWVVDSGNNRVQKFDRNLNYLLSIPVSGTAASSANGSFSTPYGIAIDADDNVWVSDNGNNRVQAFSNNGNWILSIGGPSPYSCETSPAGSVPACTSGSGNGQFNAPRGVYADKLGNIWVADAGNNRIQQFNSYGTYITNIGSSTFSAPYQASTDYSRNLWVIDSSHSQIQKCTPAGTCTAYQGSGFGNGNLSTPLGIYVTGR